MRESRIANRVGVKRPFTDSIFGPRTSDLLPLTIAQQPVAQSTTPPHPCRCATLWATTCAWETARVRVCARYRARMCACGVRVRVCVESDKNPPPTIPPVTLDKFCLVFDTGLRKVSARYGIPPANHHQLGILVLLKRKGSARFGILKSLVGRYGKSDDPSYVAQSLRHLCDWGFVSKDSSCYSITSLGREYLSSLRSYLRNYRL